MKIDLTGRVAVVTGGGRGIGRAIATTLGQAGATVVVNYHTNAGTAQETVAAITTAGGIALALQADVSQANEVEKLFKTTLETYQRLDILVNNAGITRDGLLLRMKEDDFEAVYQTNLRSVYLCAKAALRSIMKSPCGRIINLTSAVGLIGNAGQTNYAAMKAGVIGFTKSLAREVASRGITVNAVAPGLIETEMTAKMNQAAHAAALAAIPLGRIGQPQDVAQLICFLASDAAAYLTGQTLAVDGGMVMQ